MAFALVVANIESGNLICVARFDLDIRVHKCLLLLLDLDRMAIGIAYQE